MGDGFVADPDAMRAYAAQLAQYINEIGTAAGAAGTVLNENAGKLGPVTDELTKAGITKTGQLDRAYGAICQPYGVQLQNMQQTVGKAVQAAEQLMTRLRTNLQDCASTYHDGELRAVSEMKKPLGDLEHVAPADAPDMPSVPGFPVAPGTDGGHGNG